MCSATRWEGDVDVKAGLGARGAALPPVVTGTHPLSWLCPLRELRAVVLQRRVRTVLLKAGDDEHFFNGSQQPGRRW